MMEQHSRSSCPDQGTSFSVSELTFGHNGPYSISCSGAETVGISGMSGVGKTRFLRALADLDDHGGRVSLDGRDCNNIPAPVWRRRVALIPAESRWWYDDVRSHMDTGSSLRECSLLLESLGFDSDVLNWQVGRLSSGEKQRLSLARVLVRNPSVLLLDELGSSLDREIGDLLEGVIKNFQKRSGAPVLWVSHDQEQMHRVCDRLFTFQQNRLEESHHFGRG